MKRPIGLRFSPIEKGSEALRMLKRSIGTGIYEGTVLAFHSRKGFPCVKRRCSMMACIPR